MPGDIRAPQIMIRRIVNGLSLRLPDILDRRVISLVFEDGDDKADKATLTFAMSHELLHADPDEWIWMLGEEMVLSWGYDGWQSAPRVMALKKIKVTMNAFIVTLFDTSMELMRKTRTQTWSGVKRSDVVREIARDWGYSDQFIEDSELVYSSIAQKSMSDAAFLRKLAVAEGFKFWIDDLGLHWRKPDYESAPTTRLVYHEGDHGAGFILDWSVEADLVERRAATGATIVDPRTGEQATAVATSTLTTKTETVVIIPDGSADIAEDYYSPPVGLKPGASSLIFDEEALMAGPRQKAPGYFFDERDPTTLRKRVEKVSVVRTKTSAKTTAAAARREAETRFRVAAQERLKMNVKAIGDPTLRKGRLVEVEGLGPILSGGYYVASVTHRIDSGGYACDLKLKGDGGQAAKPKADTTKSEGLNAADPEARQRRTT